MLSGRRLRTPWKITLTSVLTVAAVVSGVLGYHAWKAEKRAEAECAAVQHLAAAASQGPIGAGEPVTVVGDSYTAGWGLADPRQSWVGQLHRAATVDAASGAGFTQGGLCNRPDLPTLAKQIRGPVILQGGINDVRASLADVTRDADHTLSEVDAIALVGPAPAPAFDRTREAAVDAALAKVAADHGVQYISALDWHLEFGADDLHLTPAGHRVFGQHVAAALAG